MKELNEIEFENGKLQFIFENDLCNMRFICKDSFGNEMHETISNEASISITELENLIRSLSDLRNKFNTNEEKENARNILKG